ncbi:MAG: hypothetical protein WBH40_05200 [Ignavibacteriaceae bacterium]
MGEIVFWTIIRTAITIAAVWILRAHIDDQLWYIIIIASAYLIIIHPTVIGLKKFDVKSKTILDSTICAKCVHFDPSAVLCIKHDKHPTEDYIPCDGNHWEPK